MQVSFWKYQGAGNDFVMIDNRNGFFSPNALSIKRLCNRQFGIGADGLICLETAPDADFAMVYFNADGNESTFCGNGGRCIVAFATELGLVNTNQKARFRAKDGFHLAWWEGDFIALQMKNVDRVEQQGNDYILDTGSPHFVRFTNEVASLPVPTLGAEIRYNKQFENEGINVNFVQQKSGSTIFVRTYERGVEDETLSCGTGVTASAIAAALKGMPSPIQVQTPGGDLQVSFLREESGFENVVLTGPATLVFKGTIELF